MKRYALMLIVPLVLVGCQTGSTKDIALTDGSFTLGQPAPILGFIPDFFSQDGSRMAGFTASGNDTYIEVRDVEHGSVLSRTFLDPKRGVPVLFTSDGQSLVFVNDENDQPVVCIERVTSSVAPVESPTAVSNTQWLKGYNHDFSMFVALGIAAVTNTGQIVEIGKDFESAGFDMYGDVWIRSKGGQWTSVSRSGKTTVSKRRPGYLVQDPGLHRGSMHMTLITEKVTFEAAEANVSVLWLHHDQSLGGEEAEGKERNTAALVHVATDVDNVAFVPGQDKILVTDATGAYFVPFTFRPHKELE